MGTHAPPGPIGPVSKYLGGEGRSQPLPIGHRYTTTDHIFHRIRPKRARFLNEQRFAYKKLCGASPISLEAFLGCHCVGNETELCVLVADTLHRAWCRHRDFLTVRSTRPGSPCSHLESCSLGSNLKKIHPSPSYALQGCWPHNPTDRLVEPFPERQLLQRRWPHHFGDGLVEAPPE